MRDYRAYIPGISKHRHDELRAFCYQFEEFRSQQDDNAALILEALHSATADDPGMFDWLLSYMTDADVSEAVLYAAGMPCSRSVFRRLKRDVFSRLDKARKK